VSVIPLAQERGPLAARHVASAVWCLARKPEHWHALVKLGASKRLVAAAEATVTVVLEEAKAKAARLQAERDEAKRKEQQERERAEEAAARGSRPPMRIELDLPWETKPAKEEPVEEDVVASDAAGEQPEATAERTSSSDGGDEDGNKAEREAEAEAAVVAGESDGEAMEEESPFPPRAPEDGAELRLHTLEWQLAALWLLVCDDAGDGRDGDGSGAATAASRGWQKVRQAVLRNGGGGGDTGGGGGGKRVSILPLAGVELMLGVLREHANAATAEVLGQSKVMELCAAVLVAVVMGPALAHAAPYLVQVSDARSDLAP